LKLIKIDHKTHIPEFTIEELVKTLKKLADAYYNTGKNMVTDEIYDYVKETLEIKDPENSLLEEVGAPIKGTKEKVKLPFEMGSLSKVKPGDDTLDKWKKKFYGPYIVSDKLDGASAQLYKDPLGHTFLYSRGDGTEGQNISHLIQYVIDKKVLNKLPKNVSIRGELVISKKNFNKISSYMKNARNAVSGLVNSKTVDIKIAKITDFVTYAILHPRYSQNNQMILLEELGFNVVIFKKMNDLTEDNLKKYLIERKKKSLYEMDGIVCIDDSKIYDHKGGYPDYAFAFKMQTDDQIIIANVIKVIWNPSKNGLLKPKVQITPVDLFGTTITYATAFNAKYVVDNKIGPGAKIKITKGGEVIPDILEVTKAAKNGAQLPEIKHKWNDSGVDFIMTDLDGEGGNVVTTKLLTHFFKTMGVKFLSEGIMTKLVDDGYDTVVKILKANKTKLSNIEGLGEKGINKIYDEIDRAFEEADVVTFMAASHKFGKGFGEKKIREIINVYPNILNEGWKKEKMVKNILEVDGFSDKLAGEFAEHFSDFIKFYKELSKIKDLTRFDNPESTSDEEQLFEGKSIVFTGFRDKDLEKTIISMGGKVTTSVSKNTFIVICKDDTDKSSSKLVKAEENGTKIMTKSEFIKKYDL
jgi:NAD-dependent DNA ligase